MEKKKLTDIYLDDKITKEDKVVYRHCDDGTYSIEHIMPQHLTPAWRKSLVIIMNRYMNYGYIV